MKQNESNGENQQTWNYVFVVINDIEKNLS